MTTAQDLLTRGVDTVYPSKEALQKILQSGKKLRIYQGFDPTGTQLHIGHMIGLRKLRQWQDLGHHVIFLIGDGTGQAGDPSGKTTAREKFFTQDELRKNAKEYVMQAGKIVRFEGENPVEILYNGDWLNKLGLVDILDIAGHFSLQQLSERDLFQERMKKGETVNLREFLYPLLQGYDSVAMSVDVEVGGTDQTFNMLTGRTLVKSIQNREKFVMTTPLLTDSEGRKIGKTEGNVIGLTDEPSDLFGKMMTLPDDVIVKAFEYLTDIPMEEINAFKRALDSGENPMAYKKKLAFEIVKQLNDDDAAQKAQETFEKTVQAKEIPSEMPIIHIKASDTVTASDVITSTNLVPSKSEAKRVFEQKGVKINDKTIDDPNFVIKQNSTIQVGKRKFIKVVMEK